MELLGFIRERIRLTGLRRGRIRARDGSGASVREGLEEDARRSGSDAQESEVRGILTMGGLDNENGSSPPFTLSESVRGGEGRREEMDFLALRTRHQPRDFGLKRW